MLKLDFVLNGFVLGERYFPHGVNNSEISNGKSRFDTLVSLGMETEQGDNGHPPALRRFPDLV
jgi:hypothetical protein